MRTLLADMAAGLLFFAVLLVTDDIFKATLAGIALGVGIAAWLWIRFRKLEPMQLLGLGLVVAMGGATILLHDARFMMFKPTVYFTCAGLVMLKSGWMYRYLPKVTDPGLVSAAITLARRRYINAAGVIYCVVTLGMALLNALLAVYASQKAWALFNAAGAPVVYTIMGGLLWAGAARVVRKSGGPVAA